MVHLEAWVAPVLLGANGWGSVGQVRPTCHLRSGIGILYHCMQVSLCLLPGCCFGRQASGFALATCLKFVILNLCDGYFEGTRGEKKYFNWCQNSAIFHYLLIDVNHAMHCHVCPVHLYRMYPCPWTSPYAWLRSLDPRTRLTRAGLRLSVLCT